MSHLLGFREVDTLCCHPYIIQMCGVVDFFCKCNWRVECNGESERNVGAANHHWECRTFWLHLGFQFTPLLSSNSDKWWNDVLKITGQIGCGTQAPKLWCPMVLTVLLIWEPFSSTPHLGAQELLSLAIKRMRESFVWLKCKSRAKKDVEEQKSHQGRVELGRIEQRKVEQNRGRHCRAD